MTATTRGRDLRGHAATAGLRSALRAAYRLLAHSPAAPLLRIAAIDRARQRVTATRMSDADVLEIVDLLDHAGIRSWLCGGWACDALLGEQTREHEDLDLVLRDADRDRAVQALARVGFSPGEPWDAGLLTLAMQLDDHRHRRSVALHLVDLRPGDPSGWELSLRRAMQASGLPTSELFAHGVVGGRELRCLSAPVQLTLRTGYEPNDVDTADVRLLCQRFSLPAPPGYESAPDAG